MSELGFRLNACADDGPHSILLGDRTLGLCREFGIGVEE